MSHRKAERLRRAERAEKSGLLLDYCTIPLAVLHSQLDIVESFRRRTQSALHSGSFYRPEITRDPQARDILNR